MSAANLIPKEQLRAYERWELNSFDTPEKRGAVSLTTAAQVEKIHQQAQRDGYEAGLKEGRQFAAAQAQRLAAVATAFTCEIAELDQQLAQQVLDVALDVAQQMLRGALAAKPQLILPLILDAIRSLPVLGEQRRLRLHPEDALLVRELAGASLSTAGWAIVDDTTITRGGCVAATSHGEVDATLNARWRRIVGTLGRESHWLANDEEPATA
jgi:flagellar assembly protein FliH